MTNLPKREESKGFVGCPICKFPAINSEYPVHKRDDPNTEYIHWFCTKCGWRRLERFDHDVNKEREEMKCIRCKHEFKPPPDGKNYIVCGNCADDLRQEEDAMVMAAEAETEHIMFEMNKEAYEEAQRENKLDYRYI